MKILVTGGTGFIGRNCVMRLATDRTHSVTAVHHSRDPYEMPGVKWLSADLTQPDEVQRVIKDHDILIQAAATTSSVHDTIEDPDYQITDNALMNSLMFRQAVRANFKHVVFFSCSTMLKSGIEPQGESHYDRADPIFEKYFGVATMKVYLEDMCRFFASVSRTKFTAVRHSNIYGPWDKTDPLHSHVFSASLQKVLRSESELVVWGDGQEVRDLVYVEDLIDLIELIIAQQTENFDLIYCGAGKGISVENLIKTMMTTLLGETHQRRLVFDLSRPTVNFSAVLDASRAFEKYGWRPKVSLPEGIIRTRDFLATKEIS